MVFGMCFFIVLEDKGFFKWKVLIVFIKIIGGFVFEEF